VPSPAVCFTTTMTSSESPLPITITSLRRLGVKSLFGSVPEQAALHRVRSLTFSLPTHLFYPVGLRKGFWASIVLGISPFLPGLPEVHSVFEWQFWLRLPSDSSLALAYLLCACFLAGRLCFFGHPCLRLYIASFLCL
jgi:hypothetical protein